MRRMALLGMLLPAALLAFTKSAQPQPKKWADIVVKGRECQVTIRQGAHHRADGVIRSTSGKDQRMAIIIKNVRREGPVEVESDCEILRIDFSNNAVGKPVRKIRNRALWEWKIIRE
ncbi:hypothetical protein [Hydrogenimonas sp.]